MRLAIITLSAAAILVHAVGDRGREPVLFAVGDPLAVGLDPGKSFRAAVLLPRAEAFAEQERWVEAARVA